jgi:hypothetical protein
MQTTTRQANVYHHHQKLPASTLTRLIGNDTLSFLMEAHDGLSRQSPVKPAFRAYGHPVWPSPRRLATATATKLLGHR